MLYADNTLYNRRGGENRSLEPRDMSRGESRPRGGYSSNDSNGFRFSRFFGATIKVFNGASGDDLRLETGLRGLANDAAATTT